MASFESGSFLDLPLKEFLDAVPARTPAPGGGAVAAMAASLAAGLVAMAARFGAEDWARRAEVVGRAEALRAKVELLADADAASYSAFMASRNAVTRERVVAIPLEIAQISAELAELAKLAVLEGNPNLRGDASAGADLAAAAASIGSRLVRINADAGDRRVNEAVALRIRAAAAAHSIGEIDT